MTTRSREAGPQKDETNGTWWFVADIGTGADGKRKQARRRGFATRRAAQAELDRLRVSVHEATFVAPQKLTLGEYLGGWLASVETAGLRPSTVTSYRRNLGHHVLPTLGCIRLQALTPLHLDRLYSELRTTGSRKTGGPLSPRTVRYVHTILRSALADATRKSIVTRNAADAASPPSAKAAKAPEQAWWTPDELRRFLASVAGEEHYALFRTAAMTGMRRGEVCGLRWSDVDIDAGRLEVRQQIVTVDHVPMVSEHPKTDSGRRTVDLDPATVAVLRAQRAAQATTRLAMGAGYTDRGFVFAQVDGSHLHPESVGHVFARRVARSGLPRIRFHDLRHSHAAHLIAARRDCLEISRRLGHANPAFTMSKYGHLMPKADSEAAAAVAALVDGAAL